MSGLDTKYIPLSSIQEQFWDKLYDAPLAGGTIYFFKDNQRTISKDVYTLSGNPPDYSYVSLGSSITLSSIGTLDDGLGNNLVPYLYPYDSNGNIELYYITVYNSGNQFQFAVGGFPNIPTTSEPANIAGQDNFIPNGQFLTGQLAAPGTISTTVTNIAFGGWQYIRSSNASTDTVTFPRFTSPLNGIPSGNPRYACRIACTVPSAGETYKTLQIVFQDVNRFSDPNQQLTLFFSGLNNQTGLLQLNVNLYKYFGIGGSVPTTTPIGSYAFNNTGYIDTVLPFFFGSNYGKTLGSGNDDYFAIQIELPPTLTFDISLTDFCLYLGNVDITAFPFTADPVGPYVNVKTFASSGTYTPSNGLSYATIECWGAGGGGGGVAGQIGVNMGGGGGGAGGYSRKTVSRFALGLSQTVTIGVAGTAGGSGAAGGNGASTSVGTICIANGGTGGDGSNYDAAKGGAGGVAGTGDIATPGATGIGSFTGGLAYPGSESVGGCGASTIIGGGGIGSVNSSNANIGAGATGYGAGGGGASASNTTATAAGGAGAPGYVVITEFIGS